jgi:hypothetical protein
MGQGRVHEFDLRKIFISCASSLPALGASKYAYGTALWASADLDVEIPSATRTAIIELIENRSNWKDFRAQDLGMILIGCVRYAERLPKERWASIARELFEFLVARYTCRSGLFYDSAAPGRRQFSSFATHTYLTLACFIYGEWSGDARALTLAKNCTTKLIDLQGPQGEWAWFYYTPRGRIVDYYEVYSVHQEGMAPAFLGHAERHGVSGATDALVKGFKWILGQNQLSRSMLFPREGLICRSHVRKGELNDRYRRAARAMLNAVTGSRASLIDPARLELRLECRSYELGWILWSFGQRNDLPDLHNHSAFVDA